MRRTLLLLLMTVLAVLCAGPAFGQANPASGADGRIMAEYGMADPEGVVGPVTQIQQILIEIYPHLAPLIEVELGFYGDATAYAVRKYKIEEYRYPDSIPAARMIHYEKLTRIVFSELLGQTVSEELYGYMQETLALVRMPPGPDKQLAWIKNHIRNGIPYSYRMTYESLAFNSDAIAVSGRVWIYDVSLAIIALVMEGSPESMAQAEEMLRICNEDAFISSNDPAFNNGLPFSINVDATHYFEDPYVRSGTVSWLGEAACFALHHGLNDYGVAERCADYLLRQQVGGQIAQEAAERRRRALEQARSSGMPISLISANEEVPSTSYLYCEDDPRLGAVTGGTGYYWIPYSEDKEMYEYLFFEGDRPWCAAEHNIDVYFFFRDMYYLTREERFLTAASMVKESLLTAFWNGYRFYQGVSAWPDGTIYLDDGPALDATSWGGMFLMACAEGEKMIGNMAEYEHLKEMAILSLNLSRKFVNQDYIHDMAFADVDGEDIIHGFDPYGFKRIVWSEGTLGFVMACYKIGLDDWGDFYMNEMLRMSSGVPDGAIVYATSSVTTKNMWYEFQCWPSTVGAAWIYMNANKENWERFWSADGFFAHGMTPEEAYIPVNINILDIPIEPIPWEEIMPDGQKPLYPFEQE